MTKRGKIVLFIVVFIVLAGVVFFLWNSYTGRFRFGAEAIIGCQSSSTITSYLGKPGTHLTSVNFLGFDLTVNEKVVPFLEKVQKDIKAANIGYTFNDIQSYNYRSKRGGGGTSLHSWGIAFDVNPQQNPMGSSQTDIPPQVIDIFKKYGFAWGGDWPGNPDPMHFEWYGADFNGGIFDGTTGNKVNRAVTLTANGEPIVVGDNHEYGATLGATHPYQFVISSMGFETAKFDVVPVCFQRQDGNINMKPLPENTPGTISGKVTVTGNQAPIIPAAIYLDDKLVGSANVLGEYQVNGVRRGVHTVEARILFFPSAKIKTPDMVIGENIQNLNIMVGK